MPHFCGRDCLCFKVIFPENNFLRVPGIRKWSESDLSRAQPVWEDLAVARVCVRVCWLGDAS